MTHMFAAAALVLQMSNFSGAAPALIEAAQEEVTRVYAGIGVPLEWTAADAAVDRQPAIRIVLLPYETGVLRHSEKTVMGAAVRTAGGNAVAYVYYRRVQEEAARYDVSTPLVLACAIAHELGHLLLPAPSHAAEGLMRACWSRDEFHRAEQGQLRFLPADVVRIRAGLQ